ncbi:signal peptidase II [Saccharopolyspora sp. K220]|uniref:signal peptidase II n=1 Tax=Saccharopolyspora soli TaxID=2926618 RepID=UPI001F5843C2|nr:signal peptidase II [Saccharopolyspora soli]MCI2420523.1 signal peptidase II [Saccharopolyspora soli]
MAVVSTEPSSQGQSSAERADSETVAAQVNETQTDAADPGKSPRVGSRRLLGLLFGVAVVALGIDIVTKIAVVANLEGGPPVRLLGGLLYLDVLRNPGAAFSLATGMTWLLALLAIAVVVVIIWLAPKLRSLGWAVGLGLVLGGACGNLADRIFRAPGPLQGHVVDFLSVFAPGGAVWPVFNVADSCIVCGGILVVLMSLLGRDYDGTVHRRKKAAEK